MADREVSTLGYERKNNPRLQLGRDEFIRAKRGENHYVPPYFKEMERRNLEGRQELPVSRPPTPITATEFSAAMDGGLQAVDIRSPEAFAGAFVPGSLAIPCSMLPAFAGWFLSYDAPIGLIGPEDGHDEIRTAVTHLHRLGFDQVSCVLSGGVHAWETSGRAYDRIPALYAKDLQARIDGEEDFTLLDVRSIDEWETGHLPGATHIYLGHLPDQLPKVPKDKPVVTFCGSGRRAVIAASLLKRNGYERVEDALGSMSACREVGCRIHEPQAS
jgi:hydroxyacylglutathione hydrolase